MMMLLSRCWFDCCFCFLWGWVCVTLLKKRMQDGRFLYPLVSFEKPYRGDICNELNVERFVLRADEDTLVVIQRELMTMSSGTWR